MGEFDSIRAKAIALIKKKGREVVILEPVQGTAADPTKPWRVGAGTNNEFLCRAVVLDSDLPADGPAEKIAYVPGDCGVSPNDSMRLQVGSTQYQIASSKDYDPDGVPIGFKLRLKACPSPLSKQQTSSSPV